MTEIEDHTITDANTTDGVGIVHLSRHLAVQEGANFTRFDPEHMRAKLIWYGNIPVGYYAYRSDPTVLLQIYVSPLFRENGFATAMMKDFIASCKGTLYVESPTDVTSHIITNMRREGHQLVKLYGTVDYSELRKKKSVEEKLDPAADVKKDDELVAITVARSDCEYRDIV